MSDHYFVLHISNKALMFSNTSLLGNFSLKYIFLYSQAAQPVGRVCSSAQGVFCTTLCKKNQ